MTIEVADREVAGLILDQLAVKESGRQYSTPLPVPAPLKSAVNVVSVSLSLGCPVAVNLAIDCEPSRSCRSDSELQLRFLILF